MIPCVSYKSKDVVRLILVCVTVNVLHIRGKKRGWFLIGKCCLFRRCVGFDRPNLYFEVIEKPLKIEEAFQQLLRYILSTFPQATGIVYCMTKNECEETAEFLRSNGVSVSLLLL